MMMRRKMTKQALDLTLLDVQQILSWWTMRGKRSLLQTLVTLGVLWEEMGKQCPLVSTINQRTKKSSPELRKPAVK